MQFDRFIPWWFEMFMIWNDAYVFYYDDVCDVLHMMCIMNALNDKCLESWLKWSDKYLKNIDLMFGIMNTLLSYMKIVINILKINVCIMLDDFTFCVWWVIVMIETMIEIIWMMIWNHAYNDEFIYFKNIYDDLVLCMQ